MYKNNNIIVVGGGVIGISVAYYLSKSGIPVTVLEQNTVCSGSSYGNAGLIVPSHSIPLASPSAIINGLKWMIKKDSPFYIKPRISIDLINWVLRFIAASTYSKLKNTTSKKIEMSLQSLLLYRELIETEQFDVGFHQNGSLSVYSTEHEFTKGEQESVMLNDFGISNMVMDQTDILDFEPTLSPIVKGGIFYDQDAHITPDLFVKTLADRIKSLGSSIQTGVAIKTIETAGNRLTAIVTNKETYHPSEVVFAAGAWSGKLLKMLGIRLPVEPGKGYSITTSTSIDMPKRPLMLVEGKVGVTPFDNALRFAGTLELSGLNTEINHTRIGAIIDTVEKYMNLQVNQRNREFWCGMRPMSPDGLPIIGRIKSFNNAIICSGHSTLGMTLAPASGRLVADILKNDTPIINPDPFSPNRFGC